MSSFYDMAAPYYRWKIKVNGKEYTGVFITFSVSNPQNRILSAEYPLAGNFQYAFCPAMYMQKFASLQQPFLEIPDFLLLFNREDLQELTAIYI